MASGQEVTVIPGRRMQAGQRIPRSCSIILPAMASISSGDRPRRRQELIKRPVASDWEAQPPNFPVSQKTSASPISSRELITNREPQPIENFSISPLVTAGRGRVVNRSGLLNDFRTSLTGAESFLVPAL